MTDNIESLLSNNLSVSIRVHFDFNNIENVRQLVDYLIKRYKKYNGCKIYPQLLIDFKSVKSPTDDERYALHNAVDDITKLLLKEGMTLASPLMAVDINDAHCMADNDMATTVLPDGTLGRCEACVETSTWGSIYSDKIDYDMINSFKQISNISDECMLCKFMPACRYITKCPVKIKFCGLPEKERMIKLSDSLMIRRYMDFLEENKK